eukprot:309164_1
MAAILATSKLPLQNLLLDTVRMDATIYWSIGVYIIGSLLVGELLHGIASCFTRKHGEHVFDSFQKLNNQTTHMDNIFVQEVSIYTCDLFGEISDGSKCFIILQILYYFIKVFIFPISTFIIHRNTLLLTHEWIVFKLSNNTYISVILNDTPPNILTKYCSENKLEAINYGRRAVTHNKNGNNTRVIKHKQLYINDNNTNKLIHTNNNTKVSANNLINKIKSIPSYYDLCNHNCKHVTQVLYKYVTS